MLGCQFSPLLSVHASLARHKRRQTRSVLSTVYDSSRGLKVAARFVAARRALKALGQLLTTRP